MLDIIANVSMYLRRRKITWYECKCITGVSSKTSNLTVRNMDDLCRFLGVTPARLVAPSNTGLWYLAGPYSIDPELQYDLHVTAAHVLHNAGFLIYSPILEDHPFVTLLPDVPVDEWYAFNQEVLKNGLWRGIILMNDWKQSEGTCREIEFFRETPLVLLSLKDALAFGPDRADNMHCAECLGRGWNANRWALGQWELCNHADSNKDCLVDGAPLCHHDAPDLQINPGI